MTKIIEIKNFWTFVKYIHSLGCIFNYVLDGIVQNEID